MLEEEIGTASEQGYGKGYVAELTKRATECRAIMAKIEEKYRDN